MSASKFFIIILIIIFVGIIVYYLFFNKKKSLTVVNNKNNGKKVHFNDKVAYRKILLDKSDDQIKKEDPNIEAIDHNTPGYTSWDDDYSGSLVSDNDKKEFAQKLLKEHQDYNEAHSKFVDYILDNDVIAAPEFNPKDFDKPEYQGKNIGDIYDMITTPYIVSQSKHKSMLNDTMGYQPFYRN